MESEKHRRIPFRDDMVRAIRSGQKTVTRRTSPRFGEWRPGDIVDVCEGLVPGLVPGAAAPVAMYTADSEPTATPWRWKVVRLAPRYCPAALVRTRLEVVSVTEQRSVGGGLGQMAVLLPDVDDDEARREGVRDRRAFLDLWRALNPDYAGPVWRVEFRCVAG